jgi:solute carrier family 36 (proton-coupled amino acid transporter)
MPGEGSRSSSSRPVPLPISGSPQSSSRTGTPVEGSYSRATARLGSPVPARSSPAARASSISQTPDNGEDTAAPPPLAGLSGPRSSVPRESALASALRGDLSGSPPRNRAEANGPGSTISSRAPSESRNAFPRSNYGSFDPPRSLHNQSPAPFEDAEIVRRHLAGPADETASNPPGLGDGSSSPGRFGITKGKADSDQLVGTPPVSGIGEDEFSSLRLQGGDMTRGVYRWAEESSRQGMQRRKSFDTLSRHPDDDDLDIRRIKEPQGFRRHHIARPEASVASGSRVRTPGGRHHAFARPARVPFTNSFMEFLSLYGHFAGEDLGEDDEDLGSNEYFSDAFDGESGAEGDEDREYGEDSALLTPGRRRRRRPASTGTTSPTGAAMLLLKSFVGTGVLFLPRAFLNGGMAFSSALLLFVSGLSYYCFVLLVSTRLKCEHSFGDMGGVLWGKWLRWTINFSLVISQMGFASAYMVFTSENIQAMVLAVTKCKTNLDIKYLILLQWAIFLPVSLVRKINLIQIFALAADLFIVIGLAYLFGYDVQTIASPSWELDISLFNSRDWTLFIGTAIFTFEGIGLIVPIQSSMKEPNKFPGVLAGVMVAITVIFTVMGAISYLAFGSKTETVVLLNMPQQNKFVNTVQALYAIAIMLSTPLQIYPAIEITSQQLFSTRTGRYNPIVKWQKNCLRAAIVTVCGIIAYFGASDLDKFVSIVGSVACIPLVYIYPVSFPIFQLKHPKLTTSQANASLQGCCRFDQGSCIRHLPLHFRLH